MEGEFGMQKFNPYSGISNTKNTRKAVICIKILAEIALFNC